MFILDLVALSLAKYLEQILANKNWWPINEEHPYKTGDILHSLKFEYYQDEQEQEGRQDECGEGVGNHSGRLLLWFPEQVLRRQEDFKLLD